MHKPHIFSSMGVALPVEAIYRRLGRQQRTAQVPPARQLEIERYMLEAVELIDLAGSALSLPIRTLYADRVELEDGVVFHSSSLAAMLSGANAVLLMGVTGGRRIMEAIHQDIAGADIMRGVVRDATASEVVDAGLDWVMAYYRQQLTRQGGMLMKRRYSAGYGDFSLEHQKIMHALLDLESIGVTITETCLLDPEKSVTAIGGIMEATREPQN